MPSFDDALGIHASAVALRVRRAEILAANLANADTPGYQARDLDFRAVLAAAGGADTLARTQAGHIGMSGGDADVALQYRQPLHASLDQNTVDVQAERAAFLDNALRYQASMTFLNGRIAGLVSALRGE
ncbi:MAG: flagellar basal body rod protein FlgB [Gammaproteobacteria bacterium]